MRLRTLSRHYRGDRVCAAFSILCDQRELRTPVTNVGVANDCNSLSGTQELRPKSHDTIRQYLNSFSRLLGLASQLRSLGLHQGQQSQLTASTGRTEDCTRPTSPRQIISCNAGAIHRGHQHRRSYGSGNELLWFASPPLALACSETFPRFRILALLSLLGLARVEVSHTLLLRPLPRGTPLVVLRPVGGEAPVINRQTR